MATGILTIVGQVQLNFTPQGGTLVDMTQLKALMPFPKSRATAQGYDTVNINFGNHEQYEKFKPYWEQSRKAILAVECDYDQTTSGIEIEEIHKIQVMKLGVMQTQQTQPPQK